jgi:hypothetical protein
MRSALPFVSLKVTLLKERPSSNLIFAPLFAVSVAGIKLALSVSAKRVSRVRQVEVGQELFSGGDAGEENIRQSG